MSVPDGNRPGNGSGGFQRPAGAPAAGAGEYPRNAGYPGVYAYPAQPAARPNPGQVGSAPLASGSPENVGPICTAFTVGPDQAAAPTRRDHFGPARLLGLAVAVLGLLNFCFGFLPEVAAPRLDETLSVFSVGPAYVPILLLIAGLLALATFLPGSEHSRLAVAAVSVGGAVGAIVSLGTPGSFELFANPNQVTAGMGAILLVVFGIVQAVVAIAGYVLGPGPSSSRRSTMAATGRGFIGSAGYRAASAAYQSQPAGYAATGYPTASAGYPTYGYPTAGPAATPPGNQGGPGSRAGAWNPAPSPGTGRPESDGPTGWVGMPAPPNPWQPSGDRPTGPQVVVGTETTRTDQPAGTGEYVSLSSRDTGPIPVVAPVVPEEGGGPSEDQVDGQSPARAGVDPATGETVVTISKSEHSS